MNSITCREFDERVHEYVRLDLLDVGLRSAMLEHAAQCSNCAERMAEAIVLADATKTVSESVREQQAPPPVEVALLAAFRDRHQRAVWWRTLEWVAAGAAAAMLLVVLWTSGSRTKVQLSPVQRKDVSSQSKTSIDTAVPKSSEPAGVTENTETQVANGSTSETYEVADFVPVPFTDTMGPEDPGMVVRVQLTRSSLADLGYPVAEMPDDDFIRADVLVGVDGWPRGVKLAQ